MTETMGTPPGGSRPAGGSSTGDRAKDEAKDVAQQAVQGGRQTADTARQQAGEVAGEAANQARMLLEETREQITSQGSAQKQRATSGLRSLADELSGMAEGRTQPPGIAADLARQVSQQARSVADWLESREPADVLDDVRRFARRRPGAFLLSAAAAGFLGGRLTRGMADEARDNGPSRGGAATPPGPAGLNAPLSTGAPATAAPAAPASTGVPTTPTSGGATGSTGVPATGNTGSTGIPDEPPGTPGYSVPPTGDTEGDATADYAPNATSTGPDKEDVDQMPSEFGARGTGAAGNRAEGRG